MKTSYLSLLLAATTLCAAEKPNVIFILADDIGYGDFSCYGATKIKTPNLDRLASEGLRFTDAHCPSATCTPTRYALLTGEYAWRRKGTGVLPGNAAMIIGTDRYSLPRLMKDAGYATGCIGKWHLGLGNGDVDWNKFITPGPNDLGFDYSFIMPATGDRVPCVYLENGAVLGLDPKDPIRVSYNAKVGDEPTGKERPDLLKMKLSLGHDGTIVNGISRIGFMSGGKAARWNDETMAEEFTKRAARFIEMNAQQPFFLYFATHGIHVPRVPNPRFKGTSDCGVRGDAVHEFDETVGQIMETLDRLKIAEKTLIIVTSDNGPVVNDGYADGSDTDLNGHEPAGPFRGSKYSVYEAGTRVHFIVRWPGRVKADQTQDGLFGFIDMIGSLAELTDVKIPDGAAPDSISALPYLLGETHVPARADLVLHDGGQGLALRSGSWKFVPATGKNAEPQLYDLRSDIGETNNLAAAQPGKRAELAARLKEIRRQAE